MNHINILDKFQRAMSMKETTIIIIVNAFQGALGILACSS